MILTTLPDLPPRPETAANAGFRRDFYQRWGRENAVVCGHACDAEYACHVQTLSLKMALGGSERYLLPRRDVLVDDDSYLVLGEGQRYGSVLRSARPVASFAVFFRPGMLDEVQRGCGQRLVDALDRHERMTAPSAGFGEHLRRHDAIVSPRLRRLRQAVLDGERDEQWLEERLLDLLGALLAAEQADLRLFVPADTPRRAARLELLRRLRLAADYIHAHATDPVTLDDMAAVACLSRYHFVREFGRLYGSTPHAWLTRRRVTLARRLIERGERDAERIAQASGFGSRWALRRALAKAVAD